MEVRQEGIDPPKLESGSHEQRGPTTQLVGPHDRLDDANTRGSDGEHTLGLLDSLPRSGSTS